jgi:protein-tyrosine phosphatase
MYKFAPAESRELTVFGAARPKYTQRSVEQWIEFMQSQKIQRICCLLERNSLSHYPINLLEIYKQKFGRKNLLWQPLADFQLPHSSVLIEQILPFLICSEENRQKAVVHCSGGIGRTGIVLASWLVARRGFSNQLAISAVKQNRRNPHEAIIAALFKLQNPYRVQQQLNCLLNDCRHAFK